VEEETSANYRITAEPLECRVEAGRTVVVVRVSGNFPVAPRTSLRFGFAADGRISTLEVR